jgi:metallo-beta-lactamase family protein
VLVSFQTPGSLGARLLEPTPTVRIGGREWNKWADVVALRGFSGHADHHELIHLLQPHIDEGAKATLVHGEEPALHAMHTALNDIHPECSTIAERGMRMVL